MLGSLARERATLGLLFGDFDMKKMTLALILPIALTACAKRVPLTDTFEGKGMKIGRVTLSRGELPADREESANQIVLEEQIRVKSEEILKARNLFDRTSPIAMQIHINQFRLRNAATRAFTGIFSGNDSLGGHLSVADGSSTFISKPLEVSGGNGNPFNISSDSRGKGLSNALASQAVAALQRDAIAPTQSVIPSSELARTASSHTMTSKVDRDSSAPKCTLDQIVSLKKSGVSDLQIKAACPGNAL